MGSFTAHSQEAAAVYNGTPQNVVPELLAQLHGFTRLRRDHSWVRRGYAEEIYRVAAALDDAA